MLSTFKGNAIQYDENSYEFTASITLILDGSKSIIVDTGLGTESDIRKVIENGELIKRGCLRSFQVL